MTIPICKRLRFDAARCAVGYSKGVATNIEEAADIIEELVGALTNLLVDDAVITLEEAAREDPHYSEYSKRLSQKFRNARAVLARIKEETDA